ncbi:efflux RND transporter periplasmic adaptor subunit [Massilia phyllosphaerae]|uniref:efflux RND transporter periplasmic adaptor subunit n=1 Tax=Massilia phyllosphaerae TaxID=3106034 RepID=UPI002B1CDA12|nr:efflux RND transporter periplasmic adaptor subunit [Massilia sp. SGZ-792]
MSRRSLALPILLPLLLFALLSACSKPAPPAPEVRPVRTLTLAAAAVGSSAEFSGDVRPRYESRLGFRVGGKISARKVDVGSVVTRGTVLMQLDPQDLRLGQAQAQAALRAAETTSELAQAELKRYQGLRAQNFVSQAVLDEKVAAARSSQATVESSRAALREQSNQAGYANLVSDTDGVVTAIDAEVGQVVAAGTPVVRVARTDEKEVVIGVPEDQVEALRKVSEVKVKLWADPNASIAGRIREVSPMADPATRTYTVKVAMPAREDVRLGMTAVVQLLHRAAGANTSQLRVPTSALYQDKGVTSVWVVDDGVARLRPVQVGGVAGNDVVLAGGVQAGQVVVTAGVNLLRDGQRVKILTADVARRADAEAEAAGKSDAHAGKGSSTEHGSVAGAPGGQAALGVPPAGPGVPSAAAAPAATPVAVPAAAAAVAGAAAVGAGAAVLAKAPAPEPAHAAAKPAAKPEQKAARKESRKETKKEARKDVKKKSAEHAKKRTDKSSSKTAAAHGRKHAGAGAAK